MWNKLGFFFCRFDAPKNGFQAAKKPDKIGLLAGHSFRTLLMSPGYEKDGFAFLIDGFKPSILTDLSHPIQHCPEANHPNNEWRKKEL